MSRYTPTITIVHLSGRDYEIQTSVDVASNEGLQFKSNTPPPAGSNQRVIVYTIVPGPGGTINEKLQVTRAPGEDKVTVKIEDKNGQTEGQGSQEYE